MRFWIAFWLQHHQRFRFIRLQQLFPFILVLLSSELQENLQQQYHDVRDIPRVSAEETGMRFQGFARRIGSDSWPGQPLHHLSCGSYILVQAYGSITGNMVFNGMGVGC